MGRWSRSAATACAWVLLHAQAARGAQAAHGCEPLTFNLQALEGIIYGRIGTRDPVYPAHRCVWHIAPKDDLQYIEFNTTAHQFSGNDKLELYTSQEQGTGVVATFSTLTPIHKDMMLTGSNEVYLELTARSNVTFFEMHYRCVPTSSDGFSMRMSPLWLTLWLIVVVLLLCLCCAVTIWLLRHRRNMRRDRQTARETMLVLHSELMRRRNEAYRAQAEAAEETETATAEALAAMPTQEWANTPTGRQTDGDEEECCLCMETFQDTDELRVLPCQHFFHKGCIDRWFAARRYQARSCPLCKRNPLQNGSSAERVATATDGDVGADVGSSTPAQHPSGAMSAAASGSLGAIGGSRAPCSCTQELTPAAAQPSRAGASGGEGGEGDIELPSLSATEQEQHPRQAATEEAACVSQ